jgi:hypothetical protein
MKKWCVALLFVTTNVCIAQQFEVSGTGASAFTESGAVFADLDGKGDLDLILTGDNQGILTTRVYQNINTNFAGRADIILQGSTLNISAVDWDNDNDIDLFVGGEILYRNDGSMNFTDIGTVTKADKTSKWADYDNDGDLDLLNIGWLATGTHLLRNDNGVFVDTQIEFPPGFSGDWGDFDGDGDLDIVIGGYLASTDYNGAILFEQVADTFKLVQGSPVSVFSQVYEPIVKFVNIDIDRDLELVVTGNPISTGKTVEIYDRITTNFFRLNNAVNITTAEIPTSIAAADYDNDGDFDLAIGNHGFYNNNGQGYFEVIDSLRFGKATLADVNNDGSIDVFSAEPFTNLNGEIWYHCPIFWNKALTTNSKPSPPTNLSSVQNGTATLLNWAPAVDDFSSANELTYNVYVKDMQDNIIATSQTNSKSKFQLAQNGPIINHGNYVIDYLPEGNYRWSVQAIDGNFQSSNFGIEKGFRVGMYVYIPDTNFLYPLIQLGYDVNLDSLISYNEAEALSSLTLVNKGIKDATGIEAFVNLQSLNFSVNPIGELNIRSLDKLINLTATSCELTSIEFPRDNSLERLVLIRNDFTSFDFSKLTEADHIDLGNTPFSNLNLSAVTKLKTLILINNTSLSSINLSNNISLENLTITNSNLPSLNLINNQQLIAIDLSNNASLSDVCVWAFPFPPTGTTTNTTNSPNLVFSPCLNEVYIPDNNFRQALIVNGVDVNNDGFITYEEALTLTDIQVSYRNIVDLTGLQAFKNVTIFAAEGNSITSFAIDSIPLLSNLQLRGNDITTVDLAKYPALTQIDLGLNNLTSLDASTNKVLTSIKANDNNITALAFDSTLALTELDLSRNNLTAIDLSKNPAISFLAVNNNPITKIDVKHLRDLSYLSVDSCTILQSLTVKANLNLSILLARSTQISELDLRNNTGLTKLDLYNNANLFEVCVWQLPFPTPGLTYTYNTLANTQFSLCIQDPNSWIPSENLPSNGIRFTAGFVINDTAYVGTGFTDKYEESYWAFDPITETWEQKADFPGQYQGFGKGFSANNQGYVMTHTDPLGDFWKYNANNDTWTLLPAPTGGGNGFPAGFVADNNMYVHGGGQIGVKTNAFWKFDTQTETWSQLATGPEARSNAIGFAKDSVGFIGGGSNASNKTLNDFWRYNIPSNTWEQMQDLVVGTREAVSLSHQGRLFYGGGLNASNSSTNHWVEYLPGADTMVVRANLPGPLRSGAIALSAGNFIYFGTGYNGANNYNDWWKYQTNELTSINKLDNRPAIVMYPNPAAYQLHFEGLQNDATIAIVDLQGKTIVTDQVSNGTWVIPTQVATGTYLIKITNNNHHVIKKLVIEH